MSTPLGVKRDTHFFTLLAVERDNLHVKTAGEGEGCTLHVHTTLLVKDRDTPCTSKQLVKERDAPCTSTLHCW